MLHRKRITLAAGDNNAAHGSIESAHRKLIKSILTGYAFTQRGARFSGTPVPSGDAPRSA